MRGLWLFLTGTGRCGTGYMAQVLTSVGVNCTHEGVFNPGHPVGDISPDMEKPPTREEFQRRIRLNQDNAWWGWQAESSWLAAPYLNLPEMDGCTIVHLLRHPKDVIDSQMRIKAFENKHPRFYDFQLQFLPEMADMAPLERAAYFYIMWNRIIEQHAHHRHRVDKDSTLALLDKLGIDWREKEVYDNRKYNSRSGWGKSDVGLDDLSRRLGWELKQISMDYGYEW